MELLSKEDGMVMLLLTKHSGGEGKSAVKQVAKFLKDLIEVLDKIWKGGYLVTF